MGGYTLEYIGPSGRTWVLQGDDQNAQPVTLLRKPVGLYGPPVDVQRHRVLASRETYRVSTLPQQANIELQVEVALPAVDVARLGSRAQDEYMNLLRDWFKDWPVDDGTTVAPPTGTIVAKRPGVSPRYLDVYRTEEIEPLSSIDPSVALRGKFLIVCSADDPYPRLDTDKVSTPLKPGSTAMFSVTNVGEVAVAPKLSFDMPRADTKVSVEVDGKTIAKFTYEIPGPGTFDLDPNELTFSLAGDVKPLEYWWNPNVEALSEGARKLLEMFGTPRAAVSPIAAPWGQNADALIPAGKRATINVEASQEGTVKMELTPRVERLLF